jgi:Family of unknown function (DUF5681)
MNNPQDNDGPADAPTKKTPKGDYRVGYCKPPAAHRFKDGNQANPKGRRKGARNRKVVIQEVLFEPVTVREGNQTRQMSALEALLKKLLSNALSGDNKAALTILGIAQKEGLLTPEQEQAVDNLSDNDLAIIEDAKRRIAASVSGEAPQSPASPVV